MTERRHAFRVAKPFRKARAMRTQSSIVALLLGTMATVAGSGSAIAGWVVEYTSIPGAACKMIYNSNGKEVSGATFQGTWITNTSSGTNMQALCPVALQTGQGSYVDASVTTDKQVDNCYLGYEVNHYSYSFLPASSKVDYGDTWFHIWSTIPSEVSSIGVAEMDCYMGAYSELRKVVFRRDWYQ